MRFDALHEGRGIIMADRWDWNSRIGVAIVGLIAIAAGVGIGWTIERCDFHDRVGAIVNSELEFRRAADAPGTPVLPPQPARRGKAPNDWSTPQLVSLSPDETKDRPQRALFLVTDESHRVFVCRKTTPPPPGGPDEASVIRETWICDRPLVWSVPDALPLASKPVEIQKNLIGKYDPREDPGKLAPDAR
jgi:hypothetical protein